MILSRRSFLKMAGLTVVAAAGASMFPGCGAFSTTPIKVVAAKDSTKEFQAAVAELNSAWAQCLSVSRRKTRRYHGAERKTGGVRR